jgi:hypothetical protein
MTAAGNTEKKKKTLHEKKYSKASGNLIKTTEQIKIIGNA